jgi:DNA repair protein RecN (Recombination protein N)
VLEELRIRGLGVIEDAVLPLGPGLTVVTGETGAGKTMVLTGLLLLFGDRADPARVRAGVAQASIEGRVDVATHKAVAERVIEAGGDLDDGSGLVLRRTVTAAGRSRAFVGGAAAPVAVLSELAERLITVHGQADQVRLVRGGEQRAALDRFAGLDLSDYRRAYDRWRASAHDLRDRTARAGELRREAELLAHGVAEIDAAAPQPGEDTELTRVASRLAHGDALRLAAQAGHDALLGGPDDAHTDVADVQSLLGLARRAVEAQAGADPELDDLAGRLTDLTELAAELGADFGRYAETVEADPAELAQVEDRRAVLAALIRKYAGGAGQHAVIDAVLHWADAARERLDRLDVSDEALAALRAERDAGARELARQAAAVSAARAAAAARLAAAVTTELAGLAMPGARLIIEVRPRAVSGAAETLEIDGRPRAVGRDGADEVEYLFAPRTGAPALPVGRAASGGELSRLMLALEVSLADSDPVPTMVFDEVDAGVGGRAAIEVGRRLARLAHDHQVIVVTHLAQVAAYADRHLVVDLPATGRSSGDGAARGGVTASDVRHVSGPDRRAELARMLAGTDSATARRHAAELLQEAARA